VSSKPDEKDAVELRGADSADDSDDVLRARGEEICRLAIPVAELMGDRPYESPATPAAK